MNESLTSACNRLLSGPFTFNEVEVPPGGIFCFGQIVAAGRGLNLILNQHTPLQSELLLLGGHHLSISELTFSPLAAYSLPRDECHEAQTDFSTILRRLTPEISEMLVIGDCMGSFATEIYHNRKFYSAADVVRVMEIISPRRRSS